MNLDQAISDGWAVADDRHPDATLSFFQRLLAHDPHDPVRQFELANAYDWAGHEAEAIPHYEAAIKTGLPVVRDRRARIQLASSLRNVGRLDEAIAILAKVTQDHPDSAAAECFLALALTDAGRPREAVARLIELISRTASDEDTTVYREALHRYVAAL